MNGGMYLIYGLLHPAVVERYRKGKVGAMGDKVINVFPAVEALVHYIMKLASFQYLEGSNQAVKRRHIVILPGVR